MVVPTQYVLTDREIVFHLVATNPVFAALTENPRALLSVAGDWAFIPGAWKAIGDEDPRAGSRRRTTPRCRWSVTAGSRPTPSRRRGAAHPAGRPRSRRGVRRSHGARSAAAGDQGDPDEHRDVRAKFKYGGNVDQAHRDAVAERLAARRGPGDEAALEQLRRTH